MSALFNDLQEGLLQAIDYAKGTGAARTATYTIDPVAEFNKDQIREIRLQARMSQSVFANYLGVTARTVASWERGRTHPRGSACRLLSFLAQNRLEPLPFISVA